MELGVIGERLGELLELTNRFLLFVLIKELNNVRIPILFWTKLIRAVMITETAFFFAEGAVHDAEVMVYGGIVGRYLFAMQ